MRTEEPEPPLERVTLVGLREAESPDGDTEAARLTVPAKLLRLPRLIVEVAEDPAWKLRLAGLLEILKSGGTTTFTATATEWESETLVPVSVTV